MGSGHPISVSRDGSLLPSSHADVRSPDDVITFEGQYPLRFSRNSEPLNLVLTGSSPRSSIRHADTQTTPSGTIAARCCTPNYMRVHSTYIYADDAEHSHFGNHTNRPTPAACHPIAIDPNSPECAAPPPPPPLDQRPHLVFVLVDDLGWNDIGMHDPRVLTPTLDLLASEGVVLERHYVYRYCSPTR